MVSEVYNMDCVEYIRQFPDGHFNLAVVDPPYGLGMRTVEGSKNAQKRFIADMRAKKWDYETPGPEYWKELFRVSKNQIVWGGNYFGLPAHRCFIVWDKINPLPSMSQVEQAWTSFDSPARLIRISSSDPDRIHPTQKPIQLYKWIFSNYAKPGDRILDTHLGSGNSRIAAHLTGFDFYGTEIDPGYFKTSEKRFKELTKQTSLFDWGLAHSSYPETED